MDIQNILYLVVAALMILVILTFIAFLVSLQCSRIKKNNETPYWERSLSIEHLRFMPKVVDVERNRTSTPVPPPPPPYESQFVYNIPREQNLRGVPETPVDIPEIIVNPRELIESNHSRYVFRTFAKEPTEPKIIYWETCL